MTTSYIYDGINERVKSFGRMFGVMSQKCGCRGQIVLNKWSLEMDYSIWRERSNFEENQSWKKQFLILKKNKYLRFIEPIQWKTTHKYCSQKENIWPDQYFEF
jgi:hypothetical protein